MVIVCVVLVEVREVAVTEVAVVVMDVADSVIVVVVGTKKRH